MHPEVARLRARFSSVVESEDEIRAVSGNVTPRAAVKEVAVVDEMSRRFIAASPFIFIGTVGEGGAMDVSPKGDPAGFVRVLDEKTLAIPDRLGNKRFDTFQNLLVNPAIGLIFIVPGIDWTLRVTGQGVIVRDEALREELAERGRPPQHVLVVAVESVMSHCPKCMIRSGLWRPEDWPDISDVPSLAETIKVHGKIADPVEDVAAGLAASVRDRLY
jgi:PPOX class probable FMN-dependent enzyme